MEILFILGRWVAVAAFFIVCCVATITWLVRTAGEESDDA